MPAAHSASGTRERRARVAQTFGTDDRSKKLRRPAECIGGGFILITGIAVLSYLHSMIDFSLQIPGYLVLLGILLGCGLARASAAPAAVGAVQSFAPA
jgi:hypothetical protein